MINGILNVYKEAGYTSHDVVAKLRGICRQKKMCIRDRASAARHCQGRNFPAAGADSGRSDQFH